MLVLMFLYFLIIFYFILRGICVYCVVFLGITALLELETYASRYTRNNICKICVAYATNKIVFDLLKKNHDLYLFSWYTYMTYQIADEFCIFSVDLL